MQDISTATVVGRLTRDAELRALPNGTSVVSMRIAWSQSRRDANGEWEEYPGFIDVSYFGRQAEGIHRFLSKGRQVAVSGRLQYREWGESNNRRSVIDIVAERVQLIGERTEPIAAPAQSLPEADAPATPNVPF